MTKAIRWCWVSILLCLASPALAQHHHAAAVFASGGGHGHHGYGGQSPWSIGRFPTGGHGHGYGSYGGGFGNTGFGPIGYGVAIPYAYPVPVFVDVPVIVPQVAPQGFPGGGGGLMLPMPPAQFVAANRPAPRRANPERAKEQVLIGDRSFRSGNIKRAEDKYILAAKADPADPTPHVHLAQVSLARGDYAAAADRLRDAVTVAIDPAWVLYVPDIQAIYAEPGDFARQLARLESHLQANPGDRDAWFVLGVEYYLSGRTKQASDAFQRLTDRKPDEALTAFLDASNSRPKDAN